jgi:hypothetical protein
MSSNGGYALVQKICGRQIGVVKLFTPRQKGCQIMSNDFGSGSNFPVGSLGSLAPFWYLDQVVLALLTR